MELNRYPAYRQLDHKKPASKRFLYRKYLAVLSLSVSLIRIAGKLHATHQHQGYLHASVDRLLVFCHILDKAIGFSVKFFGGC